MTETNGHGKKDNWLFILGMILGFVGGSLGRAYGPDGWNRLVVWYNTPSAPLVTLSSLGQKILDLLDEEDGWVLEEEGISLPEKSVRYKQFLCVKLGKWSNDRPSYFVAGNPTTETLSEKERKYLDEKVHTKYEQLHNIKLTNMVNKLKAGEADNGAKV